jgi:uncharacterized protein
MTKLQQQIVPILKQYGVSKGSLFGSCARGDNTNSSDIDILIKPPKHMGLGFVRLKRDLEKAVQRKVDLLSFGGISPHLRASILKYQKPLL